MTKIIGLTSVLYTNWLIIIIIVYELINFRNCDTKITFDDIHDVSDEKVMAVVERIISMWDLERGNNEIRAPATV